MEILPSGLPEHVDDEEDVARFLTQSNQFRSMPPLVKPSAFLPHPVCRNTSVFRIGNQPERLREIWNRTTTGHRSLKGAAICTTRIIRACQLDVIAEEPPAAHANIQCWPWLEHDPELQKAQQLERAAQIAGAADLVRL